jgi:hypothetical protein
MLVSLRITPSIPSPAYITYPITLHFELDGATGEYRGCWDAISSAARENRSIYVQLTKQSTLAAAMPNAKRVKRASMKQERRIAEELGGSRQQGSGSVPWRKGDGRVKNKYRIENKSCFSKGIRVARTDLSKIRSECSLGEVPLFQINFTDRATCRVEDQWILVPFEHFKELVNK